MNSKPTASPHPEPEVFNAQVGDYINTFHIEGFLGRGGFGNVYKVRDSRNPSAPVQALKMIRLWEQLPKDRVMIVKRFQMEYTCCCNKSNYLVQAHCMGEIRGNPYFVMDYCSGGALRGRVAEPWPYDKAQHLAIQILNGLQELHEQGVIHRDLKPDNILFDANDTARITDFGIAGFLNHRLTQLDSRHAGLGTTIYLPPEQHDEKRAYHTVLAATDIFAFGVLMYEVLSGGRYPFGNPRDIVVYLRNLKKGNIAPLNKRNDAAGAPEAEAMWKGVLDKCLSPQIANRYNSVVEIKSDLGYKSQLLCPHCGKTLTDTRFYTCPYCFQASGKGLLRLKILKGIESGKTYDLDPFKAKNQHLITVGRYDTETGDRDDIAIHDDEEASHISRRHASLEWDQNAGQWFIRDGQWNMADRQWRSSTNGTFVNSKEAGTDGVVLFPGDIITLGDTTIRFEWGDDF